MPLDTYDGAGIWERWIAPLMCSPLFASASSAAIGGKPSVLPTFPQEFKDAASSDVVWTRCRVARGGFPPRALFRSGRGHFDHPAPPRVRLAAMNPRSGP